MKTIMTYPEIQKMYGTPINYLTHPHQPYKPKPAHIIVGIIIIGLAAYGTYCLAGDIKNKAAETFNFKPKTKKPSEEV